MGTRKLVRVQEAGPLEAARGVLAEIWETAKLDRMLTPVWHDGQAHIAHTLIDDPHELRQADPFSPLLTTNGANVAKRALEAHPQSRIALLLKPCELRTFQALTRTTGIDPDQVLQVSADCLSAYDPSDSRWRMSDAEDRELPTQEVLHFAAQGGMLPSRYRLSCQTCTQPVPSHADVHFEFLGLETARHFILGIYTSSLETDLTLENWVEGGPSPAIDETRTRVLENLRTWRGRAAERLLASIPDECIGVAALDAHLMDCPACASHLREWCPAFPQSALEGAPEERRVALTDWLGACGGCGLCDHQCPADFPLFETVFALGRVQ